MSMSQYLDKYNSIHVPKYGNHGWSRKDMPQIDGNHLDELINWIKAKGIKVTMNRKEFVRDIQLYQNEYSRDKVVKILDHLDKVTPIIVSKDNFVLDGSHRLIAYYNKDKNMKIPVIRINLDARDAILLMNQFPLTKHRTISDRQPST